MTEIEKSEWFRRFKIRYLQSSKREKKELLNSVESTLGIHRKSAIRLLRRKIAGRKPKINRGRKSKYDCPKFINALRYIWKQTKYMNSRNLKVALPEWLDSMKIHYKGDLGFDVISKLLSISPRTIDRVLKSHKANLKRQGGTKPGSLLKTQIPIQGATWDISTPGFMEADTVAHCGNSLLGQFIWSLTMTDICTQWTECRAVWHKGAKGVVSQVSDIESVLPFKMLGFDSDCGSEFLNNYLVAYFSQDKYVRINFAFTRSRPYHKNDNAHVEQKNWTHPRALFGRDRLDELPLVAMMNDLYKNEFSLLRNHFYPNLKLSEKLRINSRYRRKYDTPKTPYARVIESSSVDTETKEKLTLLHNSLDPIMLQIQIENKINAIDRTFRALKRSHLLKKVA